MASAADRVRRALEDALDAERDVARARASGAGLDDAERAARRARAALGTGEAREQLEEAVSTRAIDDASHGALLAHLANVAEAEVLARRGVDLVLRADARVVVEDRERTLLELVSDARGPSPVAARAAITALAEAAAHGASARREALAEASELRVRIAARGPAAPDAPPDTLRETCARWLDATDDVAADLAARARHGVGAPDRSLAPDVQALTRPTRDPLVAPRGRADRARTLFSWLGLERELTRRVETSTGIAFALAPTVVAARGRASVHASGIELGIASERAMIGATARALTLALASPALAIEHARPATTSAGDAIGALFEGFFAYPTFLARYMEAGARERAELRVASAAGVVFAARLACVPIVLAGDDRVDAARELAARALVIDPALVPGELARSSRVSPIAAITGARARLAALSWAPTLRERYDEDGYRNPRLADFLRGAAARGGLVSAEQLSIELGASPEGAARWVTELAERAG